MGTEPPIVRNGAYCKMQGCKMHDFPSNWSLSKEGTGIVSHLVPRGCWEKSCKWHRDGSKKGLENSETEALFRVVDPALDDGVVPGDFRLQRDGGDGGLDCPGVGGGLCGPLCFGGDFVPVQSPLKRVL